MLIHLVNSKQIVKPEPQLCVSPLPFMENSSISGQTYPSRDAMQSTESSIGTNNTHAYQQNNDSHLDIYQNLNELKSKKENNKTATSSAIGFQTLPPPPPPPQNFAKSFPKAPPPRTPPPPPFSMSILQPSKFVHLNRCNYLTIINYKKI